MRTRLMPVAALVATFASTSLAAVAADQTGPVSFNVAFPVDAASDCSRSSVTVTYLDKPVDVIGVNYEAPAKRCSVVGRAPAVDLASPRDGFAVTAAGTARPRAVFIVQPVKSFATIGTPTNPPFARPDLPTNPPLMQPPGFSKNPPIGAPDPKLGKLAPFAIYYAATSTAECSQTGLVVTYQGSPVPNVRAVLGPKKQFCELSGTVASGAPDVPASAFAVKLNGVAKTVLSKPEQP